MSLDSGLYMPRCIFELMLRRVSQRFEENLYVLANVSLSREVWRVTADVLLVRMLVYPDVVDLHDGWENQIFLIHETEVLRHAQVQENILG